MDIFYRDLGRYGTAAALVYRRQIISYAALERMVSARVLELGTKRQLVFLEAANTPDAIISYLACLRSKFPVHLFGEGEGAKAQRLIEMYRPGIIITGAGTVFRDNATDELADEIAVLLSTSGTTGSPKFVKLSADNICSNAASIVEYLGLTGQDCAATTLRFNYSFGMSVLNTHLLAGAKLVLSDYSVVEDGFWADAADAEVTGIYGVPYSFDMLRTRWNSLGQLGSLRYLAQAGGRLAPDIVREFAERGEAGGWSFIVMYGQTEASPRMAYLPPEYSRDYPEHIGRAVPGGRLFLIDDDGREIDSVGVQGQLAFEGPGTMLGYAESAGDLAKIDPPAVLLTGDIAQVNDRGLFRIIGRSSRFVKPFGLRVSLDDIEHELTPLFDQAACAGNDDRIAIAWTDGADVDVSAVREMLAARYKLPRAVFQFTRYPELPRLDNGKIDYRTILSNASDGPEAASKGSLAADLALLLGRTSTGSQDTFISLGGDSLNYVHAALLIEQYVGHVPDGWEDIPIADFDRIAAQSSGKAGGSTIEGTVLVRALAILVVVLDHAWRAGVGSAAIVLMLVAGMNFSRFQLPKLRDDRISEFLLSNAIKIIIPYYIFVAVSLAIHKTWFWPQFLLYSNYTTGVAKATGDRLLVPYWFMENYIILMVGAAVLFGFKTVRTIENANRSRFIACILAGGVMAYLLTLPFLATMPFGRYTIGAIAWAFLLGWLLQTKKEALRSPVASAAIFAFLIAMSINEALSGRWTLAECVRYFGFEGAMLAVLMLCPRIRLPAAAKAVAASVASASFYIYLSHPFVLHFISQKGPLPMALVAVVVSALVGFVLWKAASVVEQFVFARFAPQQGGQADSALRLPARSRR